MKKRIGACFSMVPLLINNNETIFDQINNIYIKEESLKKKINEGKS